MNKIIKEDKTILNMTKEEEKDVSLSIEDFKKGNTILLKTEEDINDFFK